MDHLYMCRAVTTWTHEDSDHIWRIGLFLDTDTIFILRAADNTAAFLLLLKYRLFLLKLKKNTTNIHYYYYYYH